MQGQSADQAPTVAPPLFVIGPDSFNERKLDRLELADAADGARLIPLLTVDDVTAHRAYDVNAVLDRAERILREYPEPVGGIIGFWDFPVSLMVPVLAARLGLISPSLEAVLACEHKLWSRILQKEVAPEHVPEFEGLDPFDDRAVGAIGISFPFWIKPVKAYSSHLGFRVADRRELDLAIAAIREGIDEIGNAFNDLLEHAAVPDWVRSFGGNHCVVESIISGRQCTLEGFVCGGEVCVYGIVDSFRYPHRSSFARYEYPSRLPRRIRERMTRVAEAVITRTGLDHCAFNMEFFWDRARDRVWIIEINPRISQSHGDLFEKVDGTPHHRVLLDLAVGRKPVWVPGRGRYACAAKAFLRYFSDALVTRVPTEQEIAQLHRRFPDAHVTVLVARGMRLSQLEKKDQDSYSYTYATVFIGASSDRKLRTDLKHIREALRFEFE
ncbi:MAG: acetyl-CoA carboxylase biotin carboxylase subunit family protein [Spirochaetales bacterium]